MQLNTIDEKSELESQRKTSRVLKTSIIKSPNKNKLNKIGSHPKINFILNKLDPEHLKHSLDMPQTNNLYKINHSTNNDQSRNKHNASYSTNYTSLPHISNIKTVVKSVQKMPTFENCFKTQINLPSKMLKNYALKQYLNMEQLKTDLELLKGKKIKIKEENQGEELKENDDKLILRIDYELTDRDNKNQVFSLDEKIQMIKKNNKIKNENKYSNIYKSIEEKEKLIQEKKKIFNKISEEKKEHNKMVSFKKKIRAKVSKLINSDTYFVCSTFTQQLDGVNNKIKFTNTRVRSKKEELLKNKLIFSRSETPNYLYNINEIMREHSNPTKLFKENLTKSEIKFIRNDPKYYVQDEIYLNSVKFLNKNKTLIDRFKNEDKMINKLKKIPKFSK